jgi:hypothetical protein
MISLFHTLILAYFFPFSVSLPGSSIKEIEEDIRNVFNKRENRPDDDINVSVDQSSNLTTAIMKGLKYPTINENNNVVYGELLDFLEELCKIFKWEIYEKSTLGFRSKDGRRSLDLSRSLQVILHISGRVKASTIFAKSKMCIPT